jgi:REP element-mobilizing transposase RayT
MTTSKRTPVIAYHLIWTGYGHWLPNDPRGSGSRVIRSELLRELGEIHYGRKRIQPPREVVRAFYRQAQPRLQFPVLSFDATQIAIIGAAFAEVIESHYTCYAAAIMPDHVHLVIRRHRERSEEMAARLQATSRLRLLECCDIDPQHPIWIDSPGWQVYLETPRDVRRTIAYVERNPRMPQHWPFVTPYDDWPYHKRMRRPR